jgi:F0F1-type ATP synthase assembly protein I
MPDDRKTPENASSGEDWNPSRRSGGRSGAMKSLTQAEDLMQIAFVLPCGMLLGWGAGYVADRVLHTHWGTVTGLILGIVLGMVSVVRIAMRVMRLSGTDRQRTGKRGQ